MAFSQAVGVASVLPFISLVMDPEMVFESRWLFWAYETFNFTSVNRFIIFSGLLEVELTINYFAVTSNFRRWQE